MNLDHVAGQRGRQPGALALERFDPCRVPSQPGTESPAANDRLWAVNPLPEDMAMIDSRSPFAAASLLCAAAAAAPLTAGAQAPSYATRGETIHGTIAAVQNVNHLFVADDRGYTDDVTLRTRAAILSNGVRLEPGQRVTIEGSAAGPTFLATRITTEGRSYASDSTTYSTAYAVPVPVYYPAPVYYQPPVYYSTSLFFGFGPYYGRYRFGGYGRYGHGFRPFGGYRPGGIGVHVHIR
jgi:hypothetical protein